MLLLFHSIIFRTSLMEEILESVRIAAYATTESELFAGRWMFHVQGTLVTFQLLSFGTLKQNKKSRIFIEIRTTDLLSDIIEIIFTSRTRGQLAFGYIGDALKIVVAGVAEVGCTEAEEDSRRATVTTLVLEKVSSMLWTHLSPCHVAAATTNELGGVERVTAELGIAPSFAAVISLLTFVAHIVSVTIHCIRRWILIVTTTCCGHCVGSMLKTKYK